ncbi:unnamed protein product [Rangifer tarandus platyrhynchus]|uniref:Uncharacterized protein n=2 Tax=Rangifer tarandus platyrhynchus TaxID=3082113 RepID=A0ABN8Z057_RANTA|nr:unnamed protein product [Rangifer tarandus platyrhynchus]
MHVISVSYVISGLSDGEGCQRDSSAPHCLLSLRKPGHSGAWHNPLGDLARESQLASRGERAEVVQTLQLNSLGSLGDISFDLHSPPSPSHRPAATFSSHSHT